MDITKTSYNLGGYRQARSQKCIPGGGARPHKNVRLKFNEYKIGILVYYITYIDAQCELLRV